MQSYLGTPRYETPRLTSFKQHKQRCLQTKQSNGGDTLQDTTTPCLKALENNTINTSIPKGLGDIYNLQLN